MEYYNEIYKFKKLLRRGWLLRNACKERYESDAEHIFSTCMLALDVIDKKKLSLNVEKVLKMILYHEMGELKIGDITPVDGVTKEDKYNGEKVAIEDYAKVFDTPEMLSLWLEFEKGETEESKFVKKMDKLDAVLQAQIYSDEKHDNALFEEFYETSKEIIKEYNDIIFCEKR